ncbi:spore coat protein [Bacillus clarus]|uniref:Spore coat protein n=1 Tax=Bacillus clarus TaxID=2338372 RepID=A0A090YZQ9_9BACI|nr:hypothetical protein [Bacillus clarus]KFN04469.1 putative spore coat protein B [Bacillus clarus]RFT65825.1 spore coat protein [Bacillus clarus]
MKRIGSLVGQSVRVNLRGPESQTGLLLLTNEEYLALQVHSGEVIYYQQKHVKSVLKKAKETKADYLGQEGSYFEKDTFQDVLGNLKYAWVKINRGGPESVEGLLSDTNEEYITLVNNEEVVYVLNLHIKNVNQVTKNKKNDKE